MIVMFYCLYDSNVKFGTTLQNPSPAFRTKINVFLRNRDR